MKLVVIGGSGLIGSKLVTKLREHGHEAIAASPNSGVDTLTGDGLADALEGASVVVDVSNSPSFEDAAVLRFFETSTRNLLAAEAAAGVRHHVALSVVGTERLAESGYMRAKVAQERLIEASPIPYSIVHATQFFEFILRIADDATAGNTVRLPPVLFQPIAADDVAAAVARVAVGTPLDGTIEVAGPRQFRFDELIRQTLADHHDPREVLADPEARYFGATLGERSLVPGAGAWLGETTLEEWRRGSAQPATAGRQARTVVSAVLAAALACAGIGPLGAQEPAVTPLVTKPLADVPGKEVLMITVDYAPGLSEHVHRHDAHAFVYVLEGSVVMQVRGGQPMTLRPGQTFYEGPDDVHLVGRNASSTRPARFVVFLLKDEGAPAVLPAQ